VLVVGKIGRGEEEGGDDHTLSVNNPVSDEVEALINHLDDNPADEMAELYAVHNNTLVTLYSI
jgi:hypothetical protein